MTEQREPRTDRARRIGWFATVTGYLTILVFLTLTPAPWATLGDPFPLGVLNPRAWLSAQTWTTGAPHEFVLNILLFLPIGLLLAHWGTWRAAAIATALTAVIEIAQIPVTGRISDPRDLIANITGALLGVTIATLVRRVTHRAQGPRRPSANV